MWYVVVLMGLLLTSLPPPATAITWVWDWAGTPQGAQRAGVPRTVGNGFILMRSVNGGAWEDVATVPLRVGTGIQWTDPSVPDARPIVLRYAARAQQGGRVSEVSAPGIVTLGGQPRVPRTALTVVAVDSEETVREDSKKGNVLDGKPDTYWHTEWSQRTPPLPHWIVLDLGTSHLVDGLSYLPRADSRNGAIARYEIAVSETTTTWGTPVASGTWAPSPGAEQIVRFPAVQGRFVRLQAVSEVGGKPWTSAAEVGLYAGAGETPPPPPPADAWTCQMEQNSPTTLVLRCTAQ